jgi:hypothetical protein
VRRLQQIHALVGHQGGHALDVGWAIEALCERGQTNAAIEGNGAASHSPKPSNPPARTRTNKASWLPSASVVTSGMDR